MLIEVIVDWFEIDRKKLGKVLVGLHNQKSYAIARPKRNSNSNRSNINSI